MEDELGDILFAVVNLGRFLSLNPEEALRKTIRRFQQRFTSVEDTLTKKGRNVSDATPEELNTLWEDAKMAERSTKTR